MKVTPDNKEYCFYDVDGTLIDTEEVSESADADMILTSFGISYKVLPNYEMIEQLKKDKAGGYFVIVWHKGGTLWTKQVLKLLKLEKYVDLVIAKPDYYFDDEDPKQILGWKGKIYES